MAEAHFSPGDSCRHRIVSLLDGSRRNADICVFTITDNLITDALLRAHERLVRLRIISDNDKALNRGSDIDELVRAGLEVRLDLSEHHMHHKYALFDGALLVTGSYNWTRSAAAHNEENIVVSDDPRLLTSFNVAFEQLWRDLAVP